MRKALILLAFVLAGAFCGWVASPRAAQRVPQKVFNFKEYGAKADCTVGGATGSCTNDIAAIRKAIAGVNVAGGILEIPEGVYYQQVGDPTTDPNVTYIDSTNKALWNITADNVEIRMSPKAYIRTGSTHLCQTNTGGGTLPCTTHFLYFGNGVTVIENFRINGNGAQFAFEPVSPAAYFTGDNSANGFQFWSGKTKRPIVKDFYINGFPNVGLIDGYTSGSDTLVNAVLEDVRVIEYGAGGDDLAWYVQGDVKFERCWFITSRKSSHGVYTGAAKPYLSVKNSYFSGQDESANLGNKYGIQLYQTSGTNPIRDITIEGNVFYNVRNGMWLEHVGGYELRNISIRNNYFIRSGATQTGTAIQAQFLRDADISGNFFQTLVGGISILSSGPGKNVRINGNKCYDCTGLMNVNVTESVITENLYRRSAVPSTGATRFTVTGARNTVAHNVMIDGGSSAGSPVGMIVNGAGCIVDGNQFYATASQGYSILLQVISSGGKVINNYINHTGSAYSDLSGDEIIVANNHSNKLVTLNGTGSAYSKATGNTLYGSAQMRLTGLVIPQNNTITGGWETITGAYGGSGNLTSGTDLDHDSAAFAASYTPHAGVYKAATKTLTGNITINAPTNPIKGQTLTFNFIQDGTGGRTFTYNAVFKKSCTETTTASTQTTITFLYNGTNWVQVGDCLTGL